jgi:putative DNA primase/helicase
MNAGNLLPVAKAARAAWPAADLVICADNDRKTKATPA